MEDAAEHAQGICEYFNVDFKGNHFDPMDKGYLIPGDRGDSVKDLQRKLNQLGYSLKVDGILVLKQHTQLPISKRTIHSSLINHIDLKLKKR